MLIFFGMESINNSKLKTQNYFRNFTAINYSYEKNYPVNAAYAKHWCAGPVQRSFQK